MKFLVNRNSAPQKQPCDEAFRHKYIQVDRFQVEDPAQLPSEFVRQDWHQRGTNHRQQEGAIMRDLENEAWFVELENLDDFNRFVKKHKRVSVATFEKNPEILRIELGES